MKAWIGALWSETFFTWWAIISAVSTISTFAVPDWSGKLRSLFVVSGIAAFGWGNLKVFEKKQIEIADLQKSLAVHEARTSQLRIVPDQRSRYILTPINNIPRSDFEGGYLEFFFMIENIGKRNSVVTEYQVEIVTLGQIFRHLRSIEHSPGVQGRHSMFAMNPAQILSETGNVQIQAEHATNRGILLFHIPELTLEQFSNAGLRMTGAERRFDALHCRLTITDTTGESATSDFTLSEA